MTWLSLIANVLKKAWQKWNIRAVVLLSLSCQSFLIVAAPFRKRTKNGLWLIWLVYLLADWVANYCVGLISRNKDDTSDTSKYLLALWPPFLLLHLGGPDTITAFALEDNELWLRHLLGLIFQAVAAVYLFLLTIPGNTLWVPTVLVFSAGIIKYAERTIALYLASTNTFRRLMVRAPDAGPNYAKIMEEHFSRTQAGLPIEIANMPEPVQKPKVESGVLGKQKSEEISDVEVVNIAYKLFLKYRGIIVDMIFSFADRNESQQLFQKLNESDALRVIEVELNYIYEVFFTKVSVVRQRVGYVFRSVSSSCIVAALALFVLEEKNGFHHSDVIVTYILMYGALALDAVGSFMHFFSDRTAVSSEESRKNSNKISTILIKRFLSFRKPRWSKPKKGPYKNYNVLSTPFMFRRWSGIMSGHNLITYCLHQCPIKSPEVDRQGYKYVQAIKLVRFKAWQILKPRFDRVVNYFGARDLLEMLLYKESNPLLEKLWVFIVQELQRKSRDADDVETTQRICSARGEWVLQEGELSGEDVKKLMPYVNANEVAFDESLIMWHIATHLCCGKDRDDQDDERQFSKLLADYMLYLLVMQPTMMSAVAGIGKIRFQDTCAEAVNFFSRRDLDEKDDEKEACRKLLAVSTEYKPRDIKGDRSKSLLFDGCRLAKHLEQLGKHKWKIITQIWVEMLSYAAGNCRPTAFVQQLSKGGELISIVWLLTVHLGLGKQFQIKDGHVRAKLIVSS